MPDYVVSKVMLALNDQGKAVKGSRILIMGVAYKANVDDDRESPSYRLMEKLEALGAQIDYNDPYVPVIRQKRDFPQFFGKKSVEISGDFDLLLIATAHDQYRQIDFKALKVAVVDTRHLVQNNFSELYHA